MSIFINGVDRTPVNSLVLLNAATGNEVANRMDYTVNKAAGNDTGYIINKTDILSGGTSLIIDAQRNGTSVLTLGHKGKIIETITLEAATGNEVVHTINYTVNKATSGNSTGFVINGTLTAAPGTNLLLDIQVAASSYFAFKSNGSLIVPTTITNPGTTGNQTINKLAGRVNIAAAGTTITVTNSLVTANSIVVAVAATNDTTAMVKNVVAAAGSFVINVVGVTAETAFNWIVIS